MSGERRRCRVDGQRSRLRRLLSSRPLPPASPAVRGRHRTCAHARDPRTRPGRGGASCRSRPRPSGAHRTVPSGAWAAGRDPWLLECVAGVIEPGETPEELARREALEEAGCVIADLLPIATFLTSPGATTETVRLFCGRIDSEGVGGLHGLAGEGEDIRATVMPVEDAVALLDRGRIVNAKTIIALQWIARHYDSLKARWSPVHDDG